MIRYLAKKIYHAIGWKLVGHYPHELAKKVIIVAPHTSSKDFWIGILVKTWLDLKVTWYGKEELFTGVKGWVLRNMGCRPVDRSKNNNLVGQIVADFRDNESHTVLLAPEGTRNKVAHFKTGFYEMARQAQVPVVPIIFDFGNKEIRVVEPVSITIDGEPPIKFFEDIYRGIIGKVPANSFT